MLSGKAGSRARAIATFAVDQRARASVTSAQAALAAAKQQLDVLDAEIAEAIAAVAQARADLDTARLNLGYAEIRSPIDGVIFAPHRQKCSSPVARDDRVG
jgi:membrane fusion protein, multidrug efflux system